MKYKNLFVSILLMAVLFAPMLGAAAQTGGDQGIEAGAPGAGFTFQGYLTDNTGTPYHDSCDINVSLWDAVTGGNQIGVIDSNPGIQVMNGYFTMVLNESNQFGPNPFDGSPRYLQIGIGCQSADEQQMLTPRQPLRAAPYATYALTVAPHAHTEETWSANTTDSVLTIDNTSNTTGTALTLNGTRIGLALDAQGAIRSSATSTLELSPYSIILRDGSTAGATLKALGGGGMGIGVPGGGTVYAVLPVQTFGNLFGSDMYVQGLEVCYRVPTYNSYIDTTAVVRHNGEGTGEEYYVISSEGWGEKEFACYTMIAPTPRMPIGDATWVQFNLKNGEPGVGPYYLNIHSVKLILTEIEN